MEKEWVRFNLPFLPPSVNSLYGVTTRGGRVKVFLKSEGRVFKQRACLFMPPRTLPPSPAVFKVYVEFSSKWVHENGSIKRFDIQNLEKVLLDAIGERYGVGDERFWEIHEVKKEGADGIFVRITEEVGEALRPVEELRESQLGVTDE